MNETTTTAEARDWLDDLLVADARDHAGDYLADEGFTARVMHELPAGAVPSWRKPAVVGMWGAAAAGFVVAVPQVAIDVGREAFKLLVAHPITLPQIAIALIGIGFATWTAAAVALRSD
jgi:hypothetical protein